MVILSFLYIHGANRATVT